MPTFYPKFPVALSVFDDQDRMVMTNGDPVISWHLSIAELHEFMQTIERAIEEEPSYAQRQGLTKIQTTIQAALNVHQREHDDLVASTPSGPDLDAYLMAYTKAIKGGEL